MGLFQLFAQTLARARQTAHHGTNRHIQNLRGIRIAETGQVHQGDDLTVISWGASVFECIEAMDALPEDVSVELIDLRTINPIDIDTIVQSVARFFEAFHRTSYKSF